jgi:Sulfotransferase family
MYMRHLPLLEELFPDAQYVHLIRDGRDAAQSFLQMPEGTFTRTWAHPRTPAQFACLWRREIADARALGQRVGVSRYHEVRYEKLVADPEAAVGAICAFAAIPFESAMLDYTAAVDVSAKPHQQRLLTPPTSGVRSWREDMSAEDAVAFEAVAGELLAELGYEVRSSSRSGVRAAVARSWYDARLTAWNASASLVQRSPLWRRRHPRLSA